MKNKLVLCLGFVALLGAVQAAPAKADSFSFSISDGGGHGDRWGRHHGRHGHHGHHRWHGHHGPSYGAVIYSPPPPVYLRPTPTVVYETTVVQPRVRYVEETSLVVNPASPSFTNEYGQHCREYQSTASVGGRRSPVYGTACLQPDGAWRVVD